MGVLIAPKTGDASIKIIPQMKKHTTSSDESSKSFISTISKRHDIFFHRSNKSNGCPDAVLVKDIGVSCMLLNQNTSEISPPSLLSNTSKTYRN